MYQRSFSNSVQRSFSESVSRFYSNLLFGKAMYGWALAQLLFFAIYPFHTMAWYYYFTPIVLWCLAFSSLLVIIVVVFLLAILISLCKQIYDFF